METLTSLRGLRSDEILKKYQIKQTSQRIEVLKYFLANEVHPSAMELVHWMQERGKAISLATVYNTINIFKQAGLIREVKIPNTEKVVYDLNTQDHFHLYDLQTGVLEDLPRSQVHLQVDLPASKRVEDYELIVKVK
jgi:Fur family iron response transcriptional regulator